ncbi:MAG: NADP-dependent malic enzyme [Defluviitaleaceae bacterium]|nr:NADP-dependent malic enzyme [Defluviitaleaceae bacterium]
MKTALQYHKEWQGKIETKLRADVSTKEALALAYTPGVAEACLAIEKDVEQSYKLTRRWNTVAVISDGTAVLGLGDIGPEASMPVMEGKAALFKAYGDVDAVPLCIRSKDVDEIVNTIALIAGSFGGVNLEDIAAPRCFEIEKKLKERCDIPIFHDDQHGTAIVTLAGILNALILVGKELDKVKIVISGAGASGAATAELLFNAGATDITMLNRSGIIQNTEKFEGLLGEIAPKTNKENRTGKYAEALENADIFIGLSAPNIITKEMIESMNKDAIVFAMANPTPEIMPDIAREGGARIVATGRSDFPNQINNLLAFPGIFRGAFDAGAKDITKPMHLAAAYAIAALVGTDLEENHIIPDATDKRVGKAVAEAVAKEWNKK